MSILNGGILPGYRRPKTRGDDIRKRRPWKDGREPATPWSWRQAKAIRLLADPMNTDTLATVAKKCKCKRKTLLVWLKNPYFVQEIVSLTDHKLQRHRSRMFNALLKRGFSGSSPHIRMFFELTGDLKKEKVVKGEHTHRSIGADEADSNEYGDEDLDNLIRELTGEE